MEIWKNTTDLFLDGEVWKDIDDFPDYRISNFGRIKSFKQNKIDGKILKPLSRIITRKEWIN